MGLSRKELFHAVPERVAEVFGGIARDGRVVAGGARDQRADG